MTDQPSSPPKSGAVRALTQALALLSRIGAGLAFAVLIAAVTIQVVGRTIGTSPVWTEELTRYALLYLAAFGAGVALKTGDLVNVDLLLNAMPRRIGWVMRLLSAIAIVILAAILIHPAWRFTAIGAFQTSPAMGLRMTAVHASVLVMLALLGLFALLRVIGMLTGGDDGRPDSDGLSDGAA